MTDELPAPPEPTAVAVIRGELAKRHSSRKRRITEKFLGAALGALPWLGGVLAAAATIPGDESATEADDLRTAWLEEHQRKIEDLSKTLDDIGERFEKLGPSIDARIESPEYLGLVRQAFKAWERGGTEDKRRYVANLLTNAAGTRVCSDDVVRMFISWIELFHESHFAVIREVHHNPGSTRFDIWTQLYGPLPREDSAEADLYKLLHRDLSMGGVIRQARETNEIGQFVRKRPAHRRGPAPVVMESAFEDSKAYTLTELGRQLVHYTMNEAVSRLPGDVKGTDE